MGLPKAGAFVVAMLAGMLVFEVAERRNSAGGWMRPERSTADG
jgi:hypothetical protein